MLKDSRVQALLAVLVVVLAAGATLAIVDNGPDHAPGTPRRTITVQLGGPKTRVPGQPAARTITLDAKAQKIVAAQKAEDAAGDDADAESDLHETRLPTAASQALAEKITPPGQPAVPEHVPLAAASQPGCTTSFVRNFSERPHGAPVLEGFIHWTGSTPTAGPQGGLAIVRWFDTSASQASSNYITDQAGRCWYTVPETKKSWTEANANPWGVSVEIVNPGVQPLFTSAAGRQAVIRLMIGWHHRWHLPYRHGIVNQRTCVPIRSGFLAHRDAGPCGGGHPDVGTFNLDGLIRDAAAQDHPKPKVKPLTAGQKHACDLLNYHRHRAHQIGRWYPSRARRANELKQQISAGRCPSKYRRH